MSAATYNRLFRKLERFEILPYGSRRGEHIGHRRSPSRGTGLEFADHKEYSPGDDIRYLDWNLYARLEEEFVKIFEQEEALPVYVLLDRSASMSVGSPSKFALGAYLAVALAYVGLANQDHVRLGLVADGLVASSRPLRGKTQIFEVQRLIEDPPAGATDLGAALETFSAEARLPGIVFLISDFLAAEGLLKGVRLLAGRRFVIWAFHLVAPEERQPDVRGDVELQDIETGRTLRAALRRDTPARFRTFFEQHCAALQADLRRYGVRVLRIATNQDPDEILFTRLPKEGVFR